MLADLLTAIRAGLREYRRLRWARERIRRIQLPF